MNIKDIKIGESYRHKDNPNYCFAKPIEILKGKKTLIVCEWSVEKDSTFSIKKVFLPSSLRKMK